MQQVSLQLVQCFLRVSNKRTLIYPHKLSHLLVAFVKIELDIASALASYRDHCVTVSTRCKKY